MAQQVRAQVPAQPDLEERRGGRLPGLVAVPGPQQPDRARGVRPELRGGGEAVQVGEQAAGGQVDGVGLQPDAVRHPQARRTAQHLGDPVPAEPRLPLVGDGRLPAQEAGRQVHLVRRRDPVLGRVGQARQAIGVVEARPLVASVARDGQGTVPVGADRDQAGGAPPDAAVRGGVDLVLARGAPAVQRVDELLRAAGPQVLHAAEVGGHAGLQPGGADRERRVLPRAFAHDGPVPGEPQLHLGLLPAAHPDLLAHHPHRLPAARVPVLVRRLGVGPVDVEVLLVDREDGQAEGDVPVVADRDAGQRGLAAADDVQPGGGQVREVAQRGQLQGAVRVVGQQRAAGRGVAGADHPVVAALGVGARAGQVLLAQHRHRGGQPVDVEHVVRDRREVQPVRDGRGVRGLQDLAQLLHRGAEVPQHPRPGDLLLDVGEHAVAADHHHVLGPPAGGGAAEFAELHREQAGLLPAPVDEGVDPRDEGGHHPLGAGPVRQPLAAQVAAVEEEPGGPVPGQVGRAEHLGQPAQPAPAPQVELEEPLAGDVEALGAEEVVLAGGVDVRDPEGVGQHLHGLLQAGQRVLRPAVRDARISHRCPPR